MSEEEILTIRNIPLNKFIGFVEGGKKKNLLGIVDDMNKHPFRLNLKVAILPLPLVLLTSSNKQGRFSSASIKKIHHCECTTK